MRRAVATLSALALISVPLFAGAQSVDVSSEIKALLAQVAALQQEIATLQQTASTSTATSTLAASASAASASSGVCPLFSRTLSLGMSGPDVLALQQFLVAQHVLSAGAESGTFDAATEQAVQLWQSSHGVVLSGDAATTGFGVVGPRTRAAIAVNCGLMTQESAAPTCPLAPEPATGCAGGTWSAITDSNGCTQAWQCTVTVAATYAATGTAACTQIALSCPAGEHDEVGQNCSHSCVSGQ